MKSFQLERIGCIMQPDPMNPQEAEGTTNPAASRGPDGKLYLFPRLVAKGNYSRIGIARVNFNPAGDPVGVERLGIALEPEAEYELRPETGGEAGGGGCEDPRVSFVESLQHYTMTYTALGPAGPRIALAISEDLMHWKRIGLASFEPFEGIEFAGIDDKDAGLFPSKIRGLTGSPSIAMLHRPLFPGTLPPEIVASDAPVKDLDKESIWISYRDLDMQTSEPYALDRFSSHHRLAVPEQPWEWLKVGCGAPPMTCRHGWLLVYHGVGERKNSKTVPREIDYSAGVMILSTDDPTKILYRSKQPIFGPELPDERVGTVGNVVFPTGIDRRDDLGQPDRFDVYYGMADDRIGVAKMTVPTTLPT